MTLPNDPTGQSFSSIVANFESLGIWLLFIGLAAGIFIGLAIAKVGRNQQKN